MRFFHMMHARVANGALWATRRPGFWLVVVTAAVTLSFSAVTLGCFMQKTVRQQHPADDAPQEVALHYVYAARPLPENRPPASLPPFDDASPDEDAPPEQPDVSQQGVEDAEDSAYRQQLYENVSRALRERQAP